MSQVVEKGEMIQEQQAGDSIIKRWARKKDPHESLRENSHQRCERQENIGLKIPKRRRYQEKCND